MTAGSALPQTAVLLAGGQGTRLRPAIGDLPKVLAPVAGVPFVVHLLERLCQSSVRRALLSVGWRADDVEAALGRRFRHLELEYCRDPQPLGTGGAVRRCFEQLGEPPALLVLNGDSYSEIDIDQFWIDHFGSGAVASLSLAATEDARRYGTVRRDAAGHVTEFCEKDAAITGDALVNAGTYVLSRELLEAIPSGSSVSLERDVLPGWIGRGLHARAEARRFLDIGVVPDYERAAAHLGFAGGPDGAVVVQARRDSEPQLRLRSLRLRRRIVELCGRHGGHAASSLSCADILVALFHGAGVRVGSAGAPRDRVLLSKGHAEAALYPLLAGLGYFPEAWLDYSYHRGDCHLGAHPDHHVPGVEISSGSLGHGLGIGAGLALAARNDARDEHVYVVMGDAECMEGSVWEAAMYAGHQRLDQLVAVVDRNGLGCLEFTDSYTGLAPFAAKWRAFGWEVQEVDGHDFSELVGAIERPASGDGERTGRPRMIIANTIKGKGVRFMENDPTWHVRRLTEELTRRALDELGTAA